MVSERPKRGLIDLSRWLVAAGVVVLVIVGGYILWSFRATLHGGREASTPGALALNAIDTQAPTQARTELDLTADLLGSSGLAVDADKQIAFLGIRKSELFQEYENALKNATTAGTRSSVFTLISIAGTIITINLECRHYGGDRDPTLEDIAAAGVMLETLKADLRSLPQYMHRPELQRLVEVIFLTYSARLNEPSLYSTMPSPKLLQELVDDHSLPADFSDAKTLGIRSLWLTPEETANARNLISELRRGPPYEDTFLEAYRFWYSYQADVWLQQAVDQRMNIDMTVGWIMDEAAKNLPANYSDEERTLLQELGISALAFCAYYSFFMGLPQDWSGPDDAIAPRERDARGYPLAEVLYRVEEHERRLGDSATPTDKAFFKDVRQRLNIDYLQARAARSAGE